MVSYIFMASQLCFSAVTCFYFWQLMRRGRAEKDAISKESSRELARLRDMRKIKLTEPLSEKTRPRSFSEIRGQARGKRALSAALCGENPQHILLYGPPGVGKTAAARAALSEAAKNPASPFSKNAPFVEMDATTLRYDERGIADPLIGSVHDPIYQGAGAYGPGGIPQPKAGAVTRAHGGILFLDEIGELPPTQLNKLLKVLEDRRVFFESAYYSRENREIPRHIHDIFQNGLPADFRLVGATTRPPEELPPALRSRCTEVFFDALTRSELTSIAAAAAEKSGFLAEEAAISAISEYAENGRDAVNLMQMAGSFAKCEGRKSVTEADILWVAETERYAKRPCPASLGTARIGSVRALSVAGFSGFVTDIEAVAVFKKGEGSFSVSGAAETETISLGARTLSRRGTALTAAENALRFLENTFGINASDYEIHVNFPASVLADGPSAGLAILAALYSAIFHVPVPDTIAITGEITPRGAALPVGGILEKTAAAASAGIRTVYMPPDNAAAVSGEGVDCVGIPDAEALLSRLFPPCISPSA